MNAKPTSRISPDNLPACDLCGARDAVFVLSTARLDGPLMRCRRCGLYYVILPEALPAPSVAQNHSQQTAAEMERLAARARELALVEPAVEENEGPWRALMARERLQDLQRFVPRGRLLEVGCATGEMLAAAAPAFEAVGVEADIANSQIAQTRGLACYTGTLTDARFPAASFDVAALYHVIEHFRSPRAELAELQRVLKPGGYLVLETPNIATFWFRLLGARWRQFIPDHIFFYTPQTLTRLCQEQGFVVRELRSAGKAMSVRLFLNRLGRLHAPTADLLSKFSRPFALDERTVRLKLGDVMRLYAQRQ